MSRDDEFPTPRRRRATYRPLVLAAVLIVATAVAAVAWQSRRAEIQVGVRGGSPTAVGAANPDGQRPDVITSVHRTTADGMRLRALLVDTALDPRTPPVRSVPKECRSTERADVVALQPDGHALWAWSAFDAPPPDAVTLAQLYLHPVRPGSSDPAPTLPDGSIDPRIVGPPVPDPLPTTTALSDTSVLPGVVVARGASLRSVRVEAVDGTVDEAEAVDGLAVVGVRSGLGGYPRVIVVTSSDGRRFTMSKPLSEASTFTADGAPAQTPQAAAALAGRCAPIPPSLPQPGQQPRDVDAAVQAVTDSVEVAGSGSTTLERRVSAYADPDLARRIVDEAGPAFFAGVATSTAHVRRVVFIDPQVALFQFDLDLPPVVNGQQVQQSLVKGAFGKAVLRDGRWLVTSETLCKLVDFVAPTTCKPLGPTMSYPPEVYLDR